MTSESIGMFAGFICPWLFSHESVLKPGLGPKQFILFDDLAESTRNIFFDKVNIFPLIELHYLEVAIFFFKTKAVCEKGKRGTSLKILPFHKNLSCSFHNPKNGIMA